MNKEERSKMKKKEDILWKNTAVVCISAMLCCFLWGSAFPGIKVGYNLYDIPSDNTGLQIMFAGIRFFLAGVLVIIIGSFIYKKPLVLKKESVKAVLHLSLLQTTGQYFFFYVGLAKTTGVKSSIIQALNVFIALFVAIVIYKQEKISRNKVLGAVIGFIGVLVVELLGRNAVNDNGNIIGVGEICILMSTVAYAFSSVYMKRYSKNELPMILSGYQFAIGGLSLFVLGLIFSSKKSNVSSDLSLLLDGISDGKGIVIVIYLACVSAIAYTLWGILLKYNPVSRISVFGFLTPIFGVLLSAIFLRESRTMNIPATVVAVVLVSIGTLLAQSKDRP